ncbi:MAG: LacI family DNA-binding transcriptional regulator [Roseiflexaceae bacterium]|nr:LacI family DNA-binding transcriptional regulator [Roseiflexaceae bacterium]
MRSSTIYDVAEHAQVSIATVSRVLNSPEHVNVRTRAKVQAAIKELNFVPRAEASARARKSACRIGVLAPFFTYPSFVQRLRGVAEALSDSQYELLIYNIDTSARRDLYLSHLPITRRLDGLVVMALPFATRYIDQLQAYGLATVTIEVPDSSLSSVIIDDEIGGQMAAGYFIELGHRRCGFIGDSEVPDYAIHTSDRRLAGYRRALADAGIDLPAQYLGLAPHGLDAARQLALRMFAQPHPPTAIFSPSDTQAIGVLRAARELGLQVPQDVAIIGFDDIEVADFIGLTTIRQPLNESGRVAVDLLLARLRDRERPPQIVQLPLTLVRRETA